jgi:putative flippase GtrA
MKITPEFIRFACSSFVSFLVDISVFKLCLLLFSSVSRAARIFLATVLARICSSLVNYFLNRKLVFHSGKKALRTMPAFYLLSVGKVLASAGAVILMTRLLAWKEAVCKVIVDSLLFFVGYAVQKRVIFKK